MYIPKNNCEIHNHEYFSENQKANTGGVAYEVILKPAATDVPRPSSPPKDKSITHDDIVKKLQEAEERRLVGKILKGVFVPWFKWLRSLFSEALVFNHFTAIGSSQKVI